MMFRRACYALLILCAGRAIGLLAVPDMFAVIPEVIFATLFWRYAWANVAQANHADHSFDRNTMPNRSRGSSGSASMSRST